MFDYAFVNERGKYVREKNVRAVVKHDSLFCASLKTFTFILLLVRICNPEIDNPWVA